MFLLLLLWANTIMANPYYEAVAKTETGGVPDPWIRTQVITPSGSTAYGPLQVTQGYAERLKNNKDFYDNLDEREKKYVDKFIEQGNKFLKYGNEPKDKFSPKELAEYDKYQYGATGHLTSPEDKEMYKSVFGKALDMEVSRTDKSPEAIAKVWHGYDEKDTDKDKDKKIKQYAERLSKHLKPTSRSIAPLEKPETAPTPVAKPQTVAPMQTSATGLLEVKPEKKEMADKKKKKFGEARTFEPDRGDIHAASNWLGEGIDWIGEKAGDAWDWLTGDDEEEAKEEPILPYKGKERPEVVKEDEEELGLPEMDFDEEPEEDQEIGPEEPEQSETQQSGTEETKQDIPLDKQMDHLRTQITGLGEKYAGNEQQFITDANSLSSDFSKELAKAQAVYQQSKDKVASRQMWEGIINGIAHMAAGLIGHQTGLNLGGLKFSKQDWQAEKDRILKELQNTQETSMRKLSSGQRKLVDRRVARSQDYRVNADTLSNALRSLEKQYSEDQRAKKAAEDRKINIQRTTQAANEKQLKEWDKTTKEYKRKLDSVKKAYATANDKKRKELIPLIKSQLKEINQFTEGVFGYTMYENPDAITEGEDKKFLFFGGGPVSMEDLTGRLDEAMAPIGVRLGGSTRQTQNQPPPGYRIMQHPQHGLVIQNIKDPKDIRKWQN